MKLSKRRSQRIPIILFLASGMLGINSYSADLLDNSFINQTLIVNQEATSNQIPANTNKDKNSGINLSESNQEYSILNPNLSYALL